LEQVVLEPLVPRTQSGSRLGDGDALGVEAAVEALVDGFEVAAGLAVALA